MKVNRCDDFVFECKQGLRANPSATLVLPGVVVQGERVVRKTTFTIVNKQQDANCPRWFNGLQVFVAVLTLFLRFSPAESLLAQWTTITGRKGWFNWRWTTMTRGIIHSRRNLMPPSTAKQFSLPAHEKGCETRFFFVSSKENPREQSAETNAFLLRPVKRAAIWE